MAKRRTFSGPNPMLQAQKLWEARQDKVASTVSSSFGGSMRKFLSLSRSNLDALVYTGATHGPNKRGGNLRRSEKLFMRGATSATLENVAGSTWKGKLTNYALIIAKGRAARVKASGMYAYVLNPGKLARPETLQGWLDAVKAGLAVMTKKMGAMKPKPWRKRAVEAAKRQGLFVQDFAAGIEKANDEAGSEAGAR